MPDRLLTAKEAQAALARAKAHLAITEPVGGHAGDLIDDIPVLVATCEAMAALLKRVLDNSRMSHVRGCQHRRAGLCTCLARSSWDKATAGLAHWYGDSDA